VPLLPKGVVTFIIGGMNFSLSIDDYIQKTNEHDGTTCTIIVQFNPRDEYYWNFGNIFFERFYTEYNVGNNTIGFAGGLSGSASYFAATRIEKTSWPNCVVLAFSAVWFHLLYPKW